MPLVFLFVDFFLLQCVAAFDAFASFDIASSSSVQNGVEQGMVTFGAAQALTPGTGYWCSAVNRPDEVVTWTGILGARRVSSGVTLRWEYSPGMFMVLVSADGANFVAASAWRASARTDVSFTEHVMFSRPTIVRAVTLVMRQPRAWNFFGLATVALLVEPGPSMLMSGLTFSKGAPCVVSAALGNVVLGSCADAIAAGEGNEIFTLTSGGILQSSSGRDKCVSYGEDGSLALGPCDSGDIFAANAVDQLTLPKRGDVCVTVSGDPSAVDLAQGSSAYASATTTGHQASSVLSENQGTYWSADLLDTPVDLIISFGRMQRIDKVEINWQFTPTAYGIGVGRAGPTRDVFATTGNNFNRSTIPIGGVVGDSIRISMREAHPILGAVGDSKLVGIRSVRITGRSAFLASSSCAGSQATNDGRDKFFFVSVPEFDPTASAGVRAASLLAAAVGNRLAGALADLTAKASLLDSCSLARRKECADCADPYPVGSNSSLAARVETNHYIQVPRSTSSEVLGLTPAVDKKLLISLLDRANSLLISVKAKM